MSLLVSPVSFVSFSLHLLHVSPGVSRLLCFLFPPSSPCLSWCLPSPLFPFPSIFSMSLLVSPISFVSFSLHLLHVSPGVSHLLCFLFPSSSPCLSWCLPSPLFPFPSIFSTSLLVSPISFVSFSLHLLHVSPGVSHLLCFLFPPSSPRLSWCLPSPLFPFPSIFSMSLLVSPVSFVSFSLHLLHVSPGVSRLLCFLFPPSSPCLSWCLPSPLFPFPCLSPGVSWPTSSRLPWGGGSM